MLGTTLTFSYSTAIPEGLILLAADYFTVTIRKVTCSFGIPVEVEHGWPDILNGRKKPTEAELALWGGDEKEPDLVVQLIKKKVAILSNDLLLNIPNICRVKR
jgi:hypothetical protein